MIYKEIDYSTEHGAGQLDIVKIKSHSEAEDLVCRETPIWQMGVKNLADKAADLFSDHVGDKYQLLELRATEAKPKRVCLRLAALESELCRATEEATRVEADIVTAERDRGEKQRMKASAISASRTKKALDPKDTISSSTRPPTSRCVKNAR